MGRVSVPDGLERRNLELGAAAVRLGSDEVAWLTTVSASGQPQTSPVWFHWDGATVEVLSEPSAGKVANLATNDRVSLHLDGAGPDDLVVTIEGRAAIVDRPPRAAYFTKYADGFARLQTSAEDYAARFSVVIEITPTRARVFGSD